jgi:iron complex transport system ATP-binding protein
VLGRNGSGKSTLLRAACGLHPVTRGGIYVGGQSVHTATPRHRATWIAYVPQNAVSPDGYTVKECVATGLYSVGTRWSHHPDTESRIDKALERLHLTAIADHRVDAISGGERQRAEIARAIAQGSRLIVLDEPASHLDVEYRGMLGRLVRELASEGTTFLIAAHDIDWASQVASEVWVVAGGECHICDSAQVAHEKGLLQEAYGVEFIAAAGRFLDPAL